MTQYIEIFLLNDSIIINNNFCLDCKISIVNQEEQDFGARETATAAK